MRRTERTSLARPTWSLLLLWLLLSSLACSQPAPAPKILVAAASDLRFALDSVTAAFRMLNPGAVDIAYGSSGKLFEQISNGAPFDVFFSADIAYPKRLKEKALAISEVYLYGVGRIVIWSKKIDTQKGGMNSLTDASVKKIAIANPAHAPYGQRAEEAIAYYKLKDAIKEKLVYGENISQTAQFITSGAADIGVIALSLAVSPNMKREAGNYYLIPEPSHRPLEQGAILTKHAKGNSYAREFLEFVKSDTAESILRHFGFARRP